MSVHPHRSLVITAAALAFLAVLAGTFGAHVFRGRMSQELLEIYEVGVRYHLVHAVAVLALGLTCGAGSNRLAVIAGWLFVFGILVFAGSLYLLAMTGERWLGAITPLGGAAMLAGWLCLVAWGVKLSQRVQP